MHVIRQQENKQINLVEVSKAELIFLTRFRQAKKTGNCMFLIEYTNDVILIRQLGKIEKVG